LGASRERSYFITHLTNDPVKYCVRLDVKFGFDSKDPDNNRAAKGTKTKIRANAGIAVAKNIE
jgi:hypothetical protein